MLNIGVDFDIIDILDVDDKEFSITLSMYLGVYWKDPQLTGPYYCSKENDFTPVDLDMLPLIWVPDLYIYHLKSIKVLNVLREFAGRLQSII